MQVKNKYFFLLLLLLMHMSNAQKRIKLEQVTCFSSVGPIMNYWQDEQVKTSFINDLRQVLLTKASLIIPDTLKVPPISIAKSLLGSDHAKIFFTDPDTSTLHLYLDIYEIDPISFFSKVYKNSRDTNLVKRSRSVFVLEAWLFDSKKKNLFNESLDISVIPSETLGMGNLFTNSLQYNMLATIPIGFTAMLKTGWNILFDTSSNIQLVEMKVPSAFMADNYIQPLTLQKDKILVKTKKDISTFRYLDKIEMIRMGELLYEELKTKGKNIQKYPLDIANAIENASNSSASDFVFTSQICRDVIRDKNYLVKLFVQVNPYSHPANPDQMFTNFLPGNLHLLLNDKDTIANFTIEKRVTDISGKKIFPGKVSNGVDTSSFFILDKQSTGWPVTYNYVVLGLINKQVFSIQCSGSDNSIKEIYLNEKLVCIAQGIFNPEKFVVFDPQLAPELLNQLLIIAFNHFFI